MLLFQILVQYEDYRNCENCLLCEEYSNNAINTLSVKLLYHRKVISIINSDLLFKVRNILRKRDSNIFYKIERKQNLFRVISLSIQVVIDFTFKVKDI